MSTQVRLRFPALGNIREWHTQSTLELHLWKITFRIWLPLGPCSIILTSYQLKVTISLSLFYHHIQGNADQPSLGHQTLLQSCPEPALSDQSQQKMHMKLQWFLVKGQTLNCFLRQQKYSFTIIFFMLSI